MSLYIKEENKNFITLCTAPTPHVMKYEALHGQYSRQHKGRTILTTQEQISQPLFQLAPSCLTVPLTRHDLWQSHSSTAARRASEAVNWKLDGRGAVNCVGHESITRIFFEKQVRKYAFTKDEHKYNFLFYQPILYS